MPELPSEPGVVAMVDHSAHHTGSPLPTLAVLALTIVVAAYAVGTVRRGRLGTWPLRRTACFVLGSVLFGVSINPGPVPDDLPWVDVVPHVVTMMIAAPLIVFGEPVRLALRTLPLAGRRMLRAALRWSTARTPRERWATVLLPAEYMGTMFVLFLTPLMTTAVHSPAVHLAVHTFMLVCGVSFFAPVLARPVVGASPGRRERLTMAASVVPLTILLGALVLADAASTPPDRGIALLVIGGLAACGGVWVTTCARPAADSTHEHIDPVHHRPGATAKLR